jgi:hypothetical protein
VGLNFYFGLCGFEGTQSRCVRGAQLAKNNRPPLVHILSQMNSVHSQLSYVFNFSFKRLRWSRGGVLPLSTQVRRFKPSRSRQDFSGQKNPQHAFLRRGSKTIGPMSQICGM